MKISASIYSYKDHSDLQAIINELDIHRVDCFHIDCNDNPSVFNDIRKIRQISKTAIDLHIITNEPEKYFQEIDDLKIEYVQFQYENLNQKLHIKKNGYTRYGLGITSATDFSVLNPYLPEIDFILYMTTVPGESGGKFKKEYFQSIRKLKNTFFDKDIHIDGGINDEVSFILRNMGVSLIVSGSFIANNISVGAAMLDLLYHDIKSHFCIRDFMIDLEDLPVINYHQTDIREVLQQIEKHKLGFVFYKDEQNQFYGLTSNADYRRGLLRNLSDFNATTLDDIINRNPVWIHEDATITDMLNMIKSQNFIISFLPVLNSEKQLTGAVTFFNLIRSEL